MEQSDHDLPSLCDLPVQIGDDSEREEEEEWQTLPPAFCRQNDFQWGAKELVYLLANGLVQLRSWSWLSVQHNDSHHSACAI